MRLGVITDEVTQDFKTALEFAREHGLSCVELRSVWEKGPFDYEMDDIIKIKALSDEYNIPVVAISSPFFKCEYTEDNIKLHNEKFARLVEYAKESINIPILHIEFSPNSSSSSEGTIFMLQIHLISGTLVQAPTRELSRTLIIKRASDRAPAKFPHNHCRF